MPDFLGNLAFLFLASSKPEYNRKFDEATIIISKNTNSMGVIETIQFINKELEEKGKKEGKIKAKIEAEK